MKLFAPKTSTGLKKQLICTRFGHINSVGSIYCDECGAELVPVFTKNHPEKPSFLTPLKVILRVLALISLLSLLAVSAGFTYQFASNPQTLSQAAYFIRIPAASISGAAAGCLLSIVVIAVWRNKLSEESYLIQISLPLGVIGALGAMAALT